MDRVAFHLFGSPIYWYGIIMATSVLVAFMVGSWLCKKIGYKDDIPFETLLAAVPLGFLFARLYYVLFNEDGVGIGNFFDFSSGGIAGIAIYGGVIGACIGVFIYTRFVKKCSFFAITDILVIAAILAQCIGRWGNFFNQEVYGVETGGFHLFPFTVLIEGTPHLALFFYESILSLVGFFVLLKVFSKQKKVGTTSAVYLIWYGAVRALLEPLREADYTLMLGFVPISLAVSLLAIAFGIALLYLNRVGKISQKYVTLLKETK